MLYSVPVFVPGVTLEPNPRPGEDYAVTSPDGSRRALLTSGAVAALMGIDGRRTVHILEALAVDSGVKMPDGFFIQLIKHLVDQGLLGIIEVSDHTHTVLPGTEHVCKGCGRSCEGHLVGPIPVEEAKVIQDLLGELQEKVPGLKGVTPFQRIPGVGLCLNQVDSRCVFLQEDRKCAIHAWFGAEKKPSICRMFPYTRLYVEGETRVGILPRCARHHQSYKPSHGDPVDLNKGEGAMTLLADLAIDRAHLPAMPFTWADDELSTLHNSYLEDEARLIRYLGREDATLFGLIAVILERDEADYPPAETTALGRKLLCSAAKVLKQYRKRLFIHSGELGDILKSDTRLAEDFKRIIAALDGVNKMGRDNVAVHYTREEEGFLLYDLRNALFTRETILFPQPAPALTSLIIGFVMAAWMRARREAAGETFEAHETRFEAIAEVLTIWYRFISGEGEFKRIKMNNIQSKRLLSEFL